MKQFIILIVIMISTLSISCSNSPKSFSGIAEPDTFTYFVEQFADLRILRYQVPGFDTLSLKQKKLIYYLSQAALAGRDIIFDQNGRYNLAIRRTLEAIVESYKGDRNSQEFKNFMVYTKRVWFSNGIYHHYAKDKFIPDFSQDYFKQLIDQTDKTKLPVEKGKSVTALLDTIMPVMFDPDKLAKKVCQDTGKDLVLNSAVNFYQGVNEKEVEDFYGKMKNPNDTEPVSYGLNSKLVKEHGKIVEEVYKLDGLYGPAIAEIVKWLEKAATVTEDDLQKKSIDKLIEYYKTGSLKTWDDYNVLWVKDLNAQVDFINGFIEDYEDPLGRKATWESVVNFKNQEATHRTEILSSNAQWFEDHSPIDNLFKKKEVKGITAKVITAAQLGGDCYPATPIGINLPNADWIRKEHGSKSVTIENFTYAYDQAAKKSGMNEEFSYNQEEIELIGKYGFMTDNLHVDMHECLGHGSGQLLPGVSADALKNYQSTLEEARADLFALYYLMDPKLVELKLLPTIDAARAEYIKYIRNGMMTQLTRIQPGKDLEEAHMRNRQLIAQWCYEKGKADHVIEKKIKDGKTYFVINDYFALRKLFGELLKEVQRIKSEGDYQAGKELVEKYGVKVDQDLLKEVLERYKKLNLAPYAGFINPEYVPVEKNGEIVDIKITYPTDFAGQMLRYSKEHSFLPTFN
ncbi:MAG TPA: dihydrofolate reductase [Bacteroidales bacterium]